MDLTIKKGTELFHSTGEPFEEKDLRGGGYDAIVWTTTDSAISQTYIPVAGSQVYTQTSSFLIPSQDPTITNLQKKLGLEFDDITWGRGGRADSYRILKNPFQDINDAHDSYYDTVPLKNQRINDYIMNTLGYKPTGEDYNNNYSWKLKMDGREIVPANYQMKGRLFILVPNQDLNVYDMTYGGSIDGDLTDLDYHKTDFFDELMKKGYDGVKINDFAQSNDQGNFGHTSIGLFKQALGKVDKEIVQDVVHHDLEPLNRDYRSPEYKKHRGINEIRKMVREILSTVSKTHLGNK
jgi:hypothetical protein